MMIKLKNSTHQYTGKIIAKETSTSKADHFRHPSRLVPDENRRDELRFLQQYRADSKTAVMLKLLNDDKVVLHSFS